jgi:hypothetical protein
MKQDWLYFFKVLLGVHLNIPSKFVINSNNIQMPLIGHNNGQSKPRYCYLLYQFHNLSSALLHTQSTAQCMFKVIISTKFINIFLICAIQNQNLRRKTLSLVRWFVKWSRLWARANDWKWWVGAHMLVMIVLVLFLLLHFVWKSYFHFRFRWRNWTLK